MKECLGYNEFLRFALDFNLSSNVILSTLEIGDIYLSSIKVTDGQENIRKLTFAEFWEALVRCALVAYSKISNASPGDKIRGLFLYMWRSINDTVPRAIEERRNVTTYMGDLINGSMAFNVLADMKTTDKDNANMGENGNDGGEDGDGNNVNMSGKEFSESQLSELLARRPSIADMLNRNLNQ